jgi:hypothetical protein
MKKLFVIGLLAVAGTMFASTASAAPWAWSGSLADWAASGGGTGVIVDGDGDTAFRLFNTTTIPDGVDGYITISELEIGGADYYDVGVAWDTATGHTGGYAGGGQLVYTMEMIGQTAERIVAAALDTVITGTGTTALMILTDQPANSLITNLSSFDGSHDPLVGYAGFAGISLLGVQQLFQPSANGRFDDSHASFVVSVPEPSQLALVGAGMFGLVLARRRKT